jgi:glucokinase
MAQCTIPSQNWSLNGEEMGTVLGIKRFLLINDFVAIGYGLLALQDKDKILINKDAKAVSGTMMEVRGCIRVSVQYWTCGSECFERAS